MLDPEEVAGYEAWKEHKLTSHTDLSVSAYNIEQESAALAYEAGVRAAVFPSDKEKINSLIAANPYRGPGMMGERPKKRVTS